MGERISMGNPGGLISLKEKLIGVDSELDRERACRQEMQGNIQSFGYRKNREL